MAKVLRINWEAAAKDQVPCYFWDGEEKPEKPFVFSLNGFDKESLYPFKAYLVWPAYKHCDFILPSDREKYTEYVYTGRDNIIAALNECKPIKMEVTPEESAEIQEIAFGLGYAWDNDKIVMFTDMPYLYLYQNKDICWGDNKENFINRKHTEYFPATDSFATKEKKYRACNGWEEFQQFWGKTAKSKSDKEIQVRMITTLYDKDFSSSDWWFEYYELLDGSPIGVEVES